LAFHLIARFYSRVRLLAPPHLGREILCSILVHEGLLLLSGHFDSFRLISGTLKQRPECLPVLAVPPKEHNLILMCLQEVRLHDDILLFEVIGLTLLNFNKVSKFA